MPPARWDAGSGALEGTIRMPQTDPLDDGFLFRALLEATPDSVYVKDRQARLLRVSQSMVRNLGVAGAETSSAAATSTCSGWTSATGHTSRTCGSWTPTSRSPG